MSTQAPPADDRARKFNPVRLVSLGLLLVAVGIVAFAAVTNGKMLWFRLTGQVTVDGSTFYLQPGDNYLTQLVVHSGEYEPTETQLVRQVLKEGDVFIDVGANIGWFTVHAAKLVGEKGQVIAFEPEPSNLAMLERNVR